MSEKVIFYLIIIFIIIILFFNIMNKKCRYNEILKENYKIIKKNNEENNINFNYKNTIIQTYFDKSKIPNKVYDNIKKYAPEYNHIIYDNDECIKFLKTYYTKKIVNRFKNLKKGAHKADLFRYCYLYIYGGLYLDIKTVLIKPISDIFTNKDIIYTVLSMTKYPSIYQGIIYTPPNKNIFKKLIYKIMNTDDEKLKEDYLLITKQFYHTVKKIIKRKKLKVGLNENKYYLFIEKKLDKSHCENKLDRYNLCTFIFNEDNEKVFKTRYNDFPWL